MGKVSNIHEQVGNVKYRYGNSRKNQKEMLLIKSIITEIRNIFDEMISRSDMTEERFNEVENRLIEPSQIETQRE